MFQRTRELTLQLVRMPSVNGTADETHFAQNLHDILAAAPYFRQHPEHLRVMRTQHDPHERYNVFALVRGRGPQTVLLCGHYDVVGTENYGDLRDLATDPEALLPGLISRLQTSKNSSDQRALHELQSGDWMPGRGALDMKSGLAIGMAVLERFAQQADRVGNLLFIATPDEEATSQGMRSAVLALPQLAEEWGLSLEAAINLDSGIDESEAIDGRAVYMGSVGKLLPSVYFVGRPTHAGAPFDGINAALMAAELTRLMEGNIMAGDGADDHANHGGGHVAIAPPPITLYQTDRRTHYDVTTPATAWCAFNVLTYWRTPSHVMAHMTAMTRKAVDSALAIWRERANHYAAVSGLHMQDRQWRTNVLSYAELLRLAVDKQPDASAQINAMAQQLSADAKFDTIAISQQLIDALVQMARLEGPAAIINIGSLYYPRVALGGSERDQRLQRAIADSVHAINNTQGLGIHVRPFFPGISDMSFLACRDSAADIAAMVENTPTWGMRLQFDFAIPAKLNLPVVNIGPYGRDYHQATERVHMPYSFGPVPELVWQVATNTLRAS